MTICVRDDPDERRYEVFDGDQLAGFTQYKLTEHKIAFTHTEVVPAFAGRGLARRLVAEELEDARRRGLAVLPFCPYVRQVIVKAPDRFLDLVPAPDRSRFDSPDDAEAGAPDIGPGHSGEARR